MITPFCILSNVCTKHDCLSGGLLTEEGPGLQYYIGDGHCDMTYI